MYQTKIYKYELIQIYSIITTTLYFCFAPFPSVQNLLNALRILRLFFPLFFGMPAYNGHYTTMINQSMRVIVMVLIVICWLSFTFNQLISMIDSFYCVDASYMTNLYDGNIMVPMNEKCGLNLKCE